MVECAGLEIRYTVTPYLGFKSLSLRQPLHLFAMNRSNKDFPKPSSPAGQSQGQPAAPRPVIDPYGHHDPIPVPDAQESDTDSVWAMFEDVGSSGVKPRTTQPAPLEKPLLEVDFDTPTVQQPLRPDRHVAADRFAQRERQAEPDFDAPTELAPLHNDFDAPTQLQGLEADFDSSNGFDPTTRQARLEPEFDEREAPTVQGSLDDFLRMERLRKSRG